MITKQQALNYEEQLHPAFAGYLHDGNITERDSLATIFHLISKGYIEPIWHDNNLTSEIEGLRTTPKKPEHEFDSLIISRLFGDRDKIPSSDVGDLVKKGEIQKLIKENLSVISAFQIINEELRFKLGKYGKATFSLNGNKIDTVAEAEAFKNALNKILLRVFLLLGALMVGGVFMIPHLKPLIQGLENNPNI
jgi:hypothetical protein